MLACCFSSASAETMNLIYFIALHLHNQALHNMINALVTNKQTNALSGSGTSDPAALCRTCQAACHSCHLTSWSSPDINKTSWCYSRARAALSLSVFVLSHPYYLIIKLLRARDIKYIVLGRSMPSTQYFLSYCSLWLKNLGTKEEILAQLDTTVNSWILSF